MAKREIDTQLKNDQFTKIFDEYRAKIEEITKKTTEKNVKPFNADSQYIIDAEIDNQEDIIAEKQAKADSYRAQVEWEANKAAAEIINEAKLQARQLLIEAEETIKKEAKKKTQTQIDKILEKARKDGEDFLVRARQASEKERTEIIAASREEIEQLIKEITERCRDDTNAQSSQILLEAQDKAKKMITEVVSSSTEINKTVMGIMNKAKNTITEFESELQKEFTELSEAISEAQTALEQVTTGVFERGEADIGSITAPSDEDVGLAENTVLSVRLMGEKSNGQNGSSPLFTGQVELKSISSFEYRQLKDLMNYMANIPGIKYVQENATEKEMSVLFKVKEPLPLLDIFNDIPLIDEVIEENNGMSLILKNHANSSEK
jgi:vacuolar-type H+-ATPase subunit H